MFNGRGSCMMGVVCSFVMCTGSISTLWHSERVAIFDWIEKLR